MFKLDHLWCCLTDKIAPVNVFWLILWFNTCPRELAPCWQQLAPGAGMLLGMSSTDSYETSPIKEWCWAVPRPNVAAFGCEY
jgi:hypothetical protein